jgi:membrane associated rhomboid family serine protease
MWHSIWISGCGSLIAVAACRQPKVPPMSFDPDASPFNALPRVVILLALAIAGGELVFWAAGVGLAQGVSSQGDALRGYALQNYAFFPQAVEWMWLNETLRADFVTRFVTYPFVHMNFTQALFVVVFVLALGKMVGEVFSGMAVAVLFFGAAIMGALAYTFLVSDPRPLIGGFPGAYGLIGGYTFILWMGYGAVGANKFQAFRLIGFLLGIQLLFGMLFGSNNDWIADFAGFLTGFCLSVIVSPGGFGRMMRKLRGRAGA